MFVFCLLVVVKGCLAHLLLAVCFLAAAVWSAGFSVAVQLWLLATSVVGYRCAAWSAALTCDFLLSPLYLLTGMYWRVMLLPCASGRLCGFRSAVAGCLRGLLGHLLPTCVQNCG